jgi:hypothetical protein
MTPDRPLETFLTLVLEHVDTELAEAHRELYPERVAEHIPLSLTLLYPWIPAASVTPRDLDEVRLIFAGRPSLDFELVGLAEIPGKVVYAVPSPDEELRATMRALWAKYPHYPPYRVPGSDPPPHCTLGRLEGDHAVTIDQVAARVGPLLPVRCVVEEATLMQEYEIDRCRVQETFPFGEVRSAPTPGKPPEADPLPTNDLNDQHGDERHA